MMIRYPLPPSWPDDLAEREAEWEEDAPLPELHVCRLLDDDGPLPRWVRDGIVIMFFVALWFLIFMMMVT